LWVMKVLFPNEANPIRYPKESRPHAEIIVSSRRDSFTI
jgi:hypothetical protein